MFTCTGEDDDDEPMVGPAIPGDVDADDLVGPEPPKPKRRKVHVVQDSPRIDAHVRVRASQMPAGSVLA